MSHDLALVDTWASAGDSAFHRASALSKLLSSLPKCGVSAPRPGIPGCSADRSTGAPDPGLLSLLLGGVGS